MFLRYDFGLFSSLEKFIIFTDKTLILLNIYFHTHFSFKQDWIKEARLFLETRQACDALLAHAAAFGLEIFPQSSQKEKKCCH